MGGYFRTGIIFSNVISSVTGENVNYRIVTKWYDGTDMDDSKVDGVIFCKRGNDYLRKIGVKNIIDFKSINDTDDTMAFKRALSIGYSKVDIPEGNYTISDTLLANKNISFNGKGKVGISGFINKAFIKATDSVSIKLSNMVIDSFSSVMDYTSSGNEIDNISFNGCSIRNCTSVFNSVGNNNSKIKRFDVQGCNIENISSYAFWIDTNVDRMIFEKNTCENITRYVIRGIEGIDIRMNFHLNNNIIKNIHSGGYVGSTGVARIFQIDADNVWIQNNHFENIYTNSGATGPVNVLYGRVNNLSVSNNTHVDCGTDNGTYIYHDKSGNVFNHSFTNNKFRQSVEKSYTQSLIHSTAENITAIGNEFYNIRGACFYAGWAMVKNLIYSNNTHLDLRGTTAVRFYGALENIIHSGNIYDGITNDLQTSDSGRNGAWFVDIVKSTSDYGAINLKSYGNIYRNVNPVNMTSGKIAAAIAIRQESSMRTFSFTNELFDDVRDAIYFSNTVSMDGVFIDQCTYRNVTNKIGFQAGAARPLNLKIGNNFGWKRKAMGQVTMAAGTTSVTVTHGLEVSSGSQYRVFVTPRSLELVRAMGTYIATFDIRRAASTEEIIVDWMAEVMEDVI